MITKITYTPNQQTRPIKTKLAELVFIPITLLLIGLLFYFYYNSFPKIVLVVTSVLLLLGKESSRLWRLMTIKKKRYSVEKPYAWKIHSQEKELHPDYQEIKNNLSRMLEGYSHSIIFFIERVTPEDHQAKIYELIYQDLKKENRLVRRYFHSGDYKVIWNEDHPNKIKVEEVVDKFQNWIPIFCSDGNRLIDSDTKELSDAVFPFYMWEQRFLLSNKPSVSWSYEEDLLSVVFSIVPFNVPGVTAIEGLLDKHSGLYPYEVPGEKPELILKDDELEIPKKLEAHYGPDLTRWIAATAVCSKLDSKLTLKIGKYLSKDSPNLTKHSNIRQLSRIGWYRVEEMPDNVRKQLLNYLPIPLQNEIRLLVIEALEESPPPSPSHAHNRYRMELVSHKLLIPNFPQKNLREEFYELKSMGYMEDSTMSAQLNKNQSKLYKLLPGKLQQYAYNKGGSLFGWNIKLLIPFLFLFSGLVAMIPPLKEPPTPTENKKVSVLTTTLQGTIKNIFGETIDDAIIQYDTIHDQSKKDGLFSIEIPTEKQVKLLIKKRDYLSQKITVKKYQEAVDIKLMPKEIMIEVVDASDKNILPDATLIFKSNSSLTDDLGEASISLDNSYVNKKSLNFVVKKEGYETKRHKFRFSENNFIVSLSKLEPVEEDYLLTGKVQNNCDGQKLKDVSVIINGKSVITNNERSFNFPFKAFPSSEEVDVLFSRKGYHNKSETYKLSQLSKDQTIRLTPKSVTVKVVDSKNPKRGVKGVSVIFSGKSNGKTDKNGELKFNLEEDSPCEAVINISHSNYAPIRNRRKSIHQQPIIIELTKDPVYIFNGMLKDQCNNPIKGVKVNVRNIENGVKYSENNGIVEIPIKGKSTNDRVQLTFTKSGYQSEGKTYKVSDLKSRKNIQLSQKEIKVQVYEKGNPKKEIVNAQITTGDGKRYKTKSGRASNILLSEKGKCTQIVVVSCEGYDSRRVPLSISDGIIKIELTRKPEPAKKITFTVNAKSNHKPLSGAIIRIIQKGLNSSVNNEIQSKKLRFTQTNNSGVFTLTINSVKNPLLYQHIEKGGRLNFKLLKKEYKGKTGSVKKSKPNITIELNKKKEPAKEIRLKITTKSKGQGLKGVTVKISREGLKNSVYNEIQKNGLKFTPTNNNGVSKLIINSEKSPMAYQHLENEGSFLLIPSKDGYTGRPGSVKKLKPNITIELNKKKEPAKEIRLTASTEYNGTPLNGVSVIINTKILINKAIENEIITTGLKFKPTNKKGVSTLVINSVKTPLVYQHLEKGGSLNLGARKDEYFSKGYTVTKSKLNAKFEMVK